MTDIDGTRDVGLGSAEATVSSSENHSVTTSGGTPGVVTSSSTTPNSSTTSVNTSTANTTTATNSSTTRPSSSTSSHRWRFDIDLNFDPSWLVPSAGGSGRQLPSLSMLNEWVRNPVNFSIPSGGSSTAVNSGQSSLPVRDRPSHSVSDTHLMSPGSHGHPFTHNPRSRSAHHHRNSTDNDPDSEYTPSPLGSARRDSQSYVVDMEAQATNSDWNQQQQQQPQMTTEEQETVRSPSVASNREAGDPPNDIHDRTPAEILRHSPEARAFISVAERYSPFVLILLAKGLFDHGSGIICFLALLVTFCHTNSLLRKEVGKQSKRNLLYLAMIAVNLLVCIAFIYYVFQEDMLYYALIFLPSLEMTSIWILFWVVGITDFVAKFLTIIVKIIILSFPAQLIPFQKRGKYYLFVEQTSQFYRSLLPLHPWISYLVGAYDGSSKVFGIMLAGVYIVFKGSDVHTRMKSWRVAFTKLLQQVHYGTSPTAQQLADVGQTCPICHDSFSTPTRLTCTHIFCEECVSTWFDRERTCPMCRAKVVDDPSFRDGSTTLFVQLF